MIYYDMVSKEAQLVKLTEDRFFPNSGEISKAQIHGLNEMESQVEPYWELFRAPMVLPNTLQDYRSDQYINAFISHYTKITAIPEGYVTYGHFSEPNFPLIYRPAQLRQEGLLMAKKLRQLFSIPGFREAYLTVGTRENQVSLHGPTSPEEFTFITRNSSNRVELLDAFIQAETLLGNIGAGLFVRLQAITQYDQRNENAGQKREITNGESEIYSIMRIVQSQRWLQKAINSGLLPARDYSDPTQDILRRMTDESYSLVLDFIVSTYGASAAKNAITDILSMCLKRIRTMGKKDIHTDVPIFIPAELRNVHSKIGHLFPIIQWPPEVVRQWKLMYIDFLPGDEVFFAHLEQNYPDIYAACIEVVGNQLQQGSIPSMYSSDAVVEGVPVRVQRQMPLYPLYKNYFAPVLERVTQIHTVNTAPVSEWDASIDYSGALTYNPENLRKIIADPELDHLHFT